MTRRAHRRVVAPSTAVGAVDWEDSTPRTRDGAEDEPAGAGPAAAGPARGVSGGAPGPATPGARRVVSERPFSAADSRWLEDRPPHWG